MPRFSVSFRTLLVWAFLGVALLPSLALVRLWWNLDQLSLIAEARLAQADRWQSALHRLSEREEHLERSTRQWIVLNDPSFRTLANEFAGDMTVSISQLAQVGDPEFQHLLLQESVSVNALMSRLNEPDSLDLKNSGPNFDRLAAMQGGMDQRMHVLVLKQQKEWADSLRLQRNEADRLALFSVLLALALAMMLGYTLFRPLGRLRVMIGKLAQGVRGQVWPVSGPRDVRDLALALERLDARLVQLEAEKANFFRQVSHELKTPLAAISEAAALLADEVPGSLTAAQHEIVAIQRSNAATLRARVETLLRHDVARWLSQQVAFRCFSLQKLILQRQHEWQTLIVRKALSLNVELSVDEVLGDEQKIQTILDNLLINAIRYSPQGGQIRVSSRRASGVVVVRVADQGPGIPVTDVERIFEPFFCGKPPQGESQGSGIGLTMARTFAQLVGGDVDLLRTDDPGACFEIWWPEEGRSES